MVISLKLFCIEGAGRCLTMDCMRANKAEVRRHDWNKLHCAARDGDVKEVKKILHEVLCGVDDRTPINETALHKAVRGNAVEICKILLLQGADPNLRNKGGRTPLYFVLKPEVAELLLQAGAETDVTDKWENSTPLEYIKIRRESDNNPELDTVIEIIESWINVQAPFELQNRSTLLAAYKASIRDGRKLLAIYVSYWLDQREWGKPV
ncbi:transient receptor potential cation channel subfamily A member 1-like [Antedon mediterranea]|uniref:transient receptor potential cation channel subfamily A member 1-like n=1 Tax=Antedon mediterranea TaxID=105859 RepID=UPI003AF9C84A